MKKEEKKERLQPLSFYGYKLEDVIRAVMQVDPKPLWEEEKQRREEKARRKKKETKASEQQEVFK
jgi:hypothetical protein